MTEEDIRAVVGLFKRVGVGCSFDAACSDGCGALSDFALCGQIVDCVDEFARFAGIIACNQVCVDTVNLIETDDCVCVLRFFNACRIVFEDVFVGCFECVPVLRNFSLGRFFVDDRAVGHDERQRLLTCDFAIITIY